MPSNRENSDFTFEETNPRTTYLHLASFNRQSNHHGFLDLICYKAMYSTYITLRHHHLFLRTPWIWSNFFFFFLKKKQKNSWCHSYNLPDHYPVYSSSSTAPPSKYQIHNLLRLPGMKMSIYLKFQALFIQILEFHVWFNEKQYGI